MVVVLNTCGKIPRGRKTKAPKASKPTVSTEPKTEPRDATMKFSPRSSSCPVFLKGAQGIKMDLVFHQHCTEDSDGEVPVKQCMFRIRLKMLRAPTRALTECQSGWRTNRRNREKRSSSVLKARAFARSTENGRRGIMAAKGKARSNQDEFLGPSREQVQHNGDAAKFGGTCNQVQQVGGDQRCES